MALRGTVTAREGWQRKNVGLQKPKGLGERREHDDFFLKKKKKREYAGIF